MYLLQALTPIKGTASHRQRRVQELLLPLLPLTPPPVRLGAAVLQQGQSM